MRLLHLSLVAALAVLPGAAGAAGPADKEQADKEHGDKGKGNSMRFRGLDRNNDGRITRDEWRGNDHSFAVHDTNHDGFLSGTEIGAALQDEGYDDFMEIDRNHDARISREEWRWDRAAFDRIDDNHDGWLTRPEYMDTTHDGPDSHFPAPVPGSPNAPVTPTAPIPEDPQARFNRLDRNHNGLISRDEWDGDRKEFNALDDNNNDALSRMEFLNLTPEMRNARFKALDLNGNGTITRSEWKGDKQAFSRLDANNDDKLERTEFLKRSEELQRTFYGMDHDRDGWLSRKEWRGERKLFDNLDDDHDGRVSLAEFTGLR